MTLSTPFCNIASGTTPDIFPATAREGCGILLVAVAPGVDGDAEPIRKFTDRVSAAYPGVPVRWAFTGKPATDGDGAALAAPGLRESLSVLRSAGTSRVALQPLHCIPGLEYTALTAKVKRLYQALGFDTLRVGAPLLADTPGVRALAEAMREHAKAFRAPDEGVVWVGHGTEHAGQARYEELGALLRVESPFIMTGTVRAGAKGVAGVLDELVAQRLDKVLLAPFFAFPGRHAVRDLAGEGENSWRSQLEAAGVSCRTRLTGMAEDDAFAAIWLSHLDQALHQACAPAATDS